MPRKLSRGTLAVRAAGYGTRANFERVRESSDFRRLAAKWAEANGMSAEAAMRATSRFTREFGRAFYRDGKALTNAERRRRGLDQPGGRIARLLEDAGVRDKGASYPVGETPKGK